MKCIFCLSVVVIHTGQLFPNIWVYYLLRSFTAFAVPGFFAISGYLLFFRREYEYKTVIRKFVVKYGIIFVIGWLIYAMVNYFTSGEMDKTFLQYAIVNSDGWHLWYLKDYVQILIIYPIISFITKNKIILKSYSALWILLVSLRYTLSLMVSVEALRVIQIPLFQFTGYVGGTALAFNPTECMGLMVAGGAWINYVKRNGIEQIGKNMMFYAFLACLGIGTGFAGVVFTVYRNYSFDIPLQPFHIYVVVGMAGFVGLCILLFGRRQYGREQHKIIWLMADCSLGIYIIHPLTKLVIMRLLNQYMPESIGKNVIIYISTAIGSFLLVFIGKAVGKRIESALHNKFVKKISS